MNSRPILFSAPMVKAILEGKKTQTRRAVKGNPTHFKWEGRLPRIMREPRTDWEVIRPYAEPGDSRWVPEGIEVIDRGTPGGGYIPTIVYTADKWERALTPEEADYYPNRPKRIPLSHCPRWASRITLEVCDVWGERLQEISEADAIAEGVQKTCTYCYGMEPPVDGMRGEYARLWDEINEKRGYPFSANPWVWVIEFRRITP